MTERVSLLEAYDYYCKLRNNKNFTDVYYEIDFDYGTFDIYAKPKKPMKYIKLDFVMSSNNMLSELLMEKNNEQS